MQVPADFMCASLLVNIVACVYFCIWLICMSQVGSFSAQECFFSFVIKREKAIYAFILFLDLCFRDITNNLSFTVTLSWLSTQVIIIATTGVFHMVNMLADRYANLFNYLWPVLSDLPEMRYDIRIFLSNTADVWNFQSVHNYYYDFLWI